MNYRFPKTLCRRALCLLLVICILPISCFAAEALPENYTQAEGSFCLAEDSRFYFAAAEAPTGRAAETLSLLSGEYAACGFPTQSPMDILWGPEDGAEAGDILLILKEGMEAQSYTVHVDPTGARITASDLTGLLYGGRMLLKLFLSQGNNEIPACALSDTPDTKERTLMLDCARKYWSVEWIENLIAQLSWQGYNALQLHLAEDQGIRTDIWSEGADKNGNDFSWLIGYDQNWNSDYPDPNADRYYTAEDMRRIAVCAEKYHIQLIADYDVPPHCDVMTRRYENYVAEHPDYSFCYNGVTYSEAGMTVNGELQPYDRYTYPNADFYHIRVGSTRQTVDVTNPVARAFSLAVVQAYADFFRDLGCTAFNLGCDELSLSDSDGWTDYAQRHVSGGSSSYDTLIDYVNEVSALLKSEGYTSIRAFNDVLYDKRIHIELDPDIELLVWSLSDSGLVEDYLQDGRGLYNCIQNYCYYVLRVNSQGDARSEDNYWWSFHHSTGELIYNQWDPSRMYNYDVQGVPVAGENLLGGYFLIWGDFGGYRTEEEVWYGDGEDGMFNLIDRLWANSAKMLRWDLNESMDYERFAAVTEKIRYFPGYTHCSEPLTQLPSGMFLQATDRSGLEALLDERVTNELGLYTAESYAVYEEAYAVAEAVCADPAAGQGELDQAAGALRLACQGLTYRMARVNIQIVDQDSGEFVDLIFLEEGFGQFFLTKVPSYEGYAVASVQGNAVYIPVEEGGMLWGMVETGATVRLFVEKQP